MSFLSRLRSKLSLPASEETATPALARAEQLMREGGSVHDIRQIAESSEVEGLIDLAWRDLLMGRLESGFRSAYQAADDRPYDVDSRIIHGTLRLARNDLDHAEHEFDAVIEEFGAEPDAADGRRATILARGFAPLDELPASDEEWESAAVLLTTLWRMADVVEERLEALSGGHPRGKSVIMRALAKGQATDSEAGDGSL